MLDNNFSLDVIMAAYNQPDFTRLTLEGYLKQEYTNFRIIIADDGSGEKIADLVREFRDKGLDVRHVWHEDKGFRKALTVNKGIKLSSADYIILTDNDCIPQKDFISDHIKVASQGKFVIGRRIELGPEITKKFIKRELEINMINNRAWLLNMSIKRMVRHAEHGMRYPWIISNLWSIKKAGMIGANAGVWRRDLLNINGYDSAFEGYGKADVDLEWRLIESGVKPRPLLGRGCYAHLYHTVRSGTERNYEWMLEKQQRKEIRARNGIAELPEDITFNI